MSSEEKPNWVDGLTARTVQSGSSGMFRGAAATGISIALISATPAVPEDWEWYFQGCCVAICSAGTLKILYHLLFDET